MFYLLLNVLTNATYLVPAYFAWTRRFHQVAAHFLAVFVVSNLYHLCRDLDACLGQPVTYLRVADHVVALLAVGRTILTLALFTPVRIDVYRDSSGLNVMQQFRALSPYVLIPTGLSNLIGVIYDAVVIYTGIVHFGSSLEYLVSIGLPTGWVVATLIFDRKAWRFALKYRFSFPLLCVFVGAALLAGFLFLLPSYYIGEWFHPLWHVLGAISATFWLEGTANGLRVFELADLVTLL
jgi:hypothetical protein